MAKIGSPDLVAKLGTFGWVSIPFWQKPMIFLWPKICLEVGAKVDALDGKEWCRGILVSVPSAIPKDPKDSGCFFWSSFLSEKIARFEN